MRDIISDVLKLHDRWHGMCRRAESENLPLDQLWKGSIGRERFVRWSLENGFSPDLVIDRRDNLLGYSPSNCQWITNQENVAKECRIIEYQGKKYTQRELAKIAGISRECFWGRLKLGWPIERIMTTPSSHGSNQYQMQ